MENLPSIPKPDIDLSTPSFIKDGFGKIDQTFNEVNKEMERIEEEGTPLRPGLQKIRKGLNQGIQGMTKGKEAGEKHLMEKIHMFEDIWKQSDKIYSDFNVLRRTYPEATALGGVGAFTFTNFLIGGKVGGTRGFFMGSLVVGCSAAYFNYYDRKVLKKLQRREEKK